MPAKKLKNGNSNKKPVKSAKEATSFQGQVLTGRVVSTKNAKTAVVLVSRQKTHPVYKKGYTQTKRYSVHDLLEVSEGDLVEMIKIKPISKNKHWQIKRVLGKDIEAIVSKQLKEEAAEAIAEVLPEKEELAEVQEGGKKDGSA